MTSTPERGERAAAWVTAIGVGLITLMVAWLLGKRVAAFFMDRPEGPVLAMLSALALSLASVLVWGRRLQHRAPRRGDHSTGDQFDQE